MIQKEIADNCRQLMRQVNAWVDPLDAEERKSLGRFCRLVEELEGHQIFHDLLQHNRIDWRLKIEDGSVVSGHIEKLNETDLGAFVPLARLFTQKREHASIRKIAAIFDKRVSERHKIWWTFNAYRIGLQQFLALTAPNLPETFGDLFDVFINGHYVHREGPKEEKYESWKENSSTFTNRKVGFLLAVGSIFSHVRFMRDSVKQLLDVTDPLRPESPKKVLTLPNGLTEPLFSDEIVSLNMGAAAHIADGDRVSISQRLVGHLVDFLGDDLFPHVGAGHIGQIKLHEYGTKMGDRWIDRHTGASVMFPVSWTSIEKSSGLTTITSHAGKPIVFVTQEFFSHLERADRGTHQWELVL